jgi:hypothetical protein
MHCLRKLLWRRKAHALKKVAFVDFPTLLMLISPMEESACIKELFLVNFSLCTCSFMAKVKGARVEKTSRQFFPT